MSFPFEIQDVEPELNKQLLQDFTGERTNFLQVGPKKYFLPSKYREQGPEIFNFKVRPDDVWIATYPRSGTTLMQEMLWLLANDLDYKTGNEIPLVARAHFIEFGILVHDDLLAEILKLVEGDPERTKIAREFAANRVPVLDEMPSPRVIKTHLPFSLLPPNLLQTAKVVYVARNPKDMIVSFFHHNRLLRTQGYNKDFARYWDYFEKDLLPWTPFWEHIKEAWELREEKNLLFLFYEDLVDDLPGCIKKVSDFLGKKMTADDVHRLANHLHIDNFRKNPSTNLDAENLPGLRVQGEQDFIRKGKNGSWKEELFTSELIARADKWISENMSQIPDFAFPTP
ncbi:sulfotransferase 4A1-like [Neocloeon triangulifer]|uniref:sulfotransferase 4A1-like n=1 Tax=Neocloeon triangulifer TaxID=2078957 RepID=UPI00286F8265|nr:sulfotransferase 4A1-like [Neocloeon triangulifer]XP_059490215.1 sulfotransferase 4A1-like [Neocloeon triangulifer]